MGARSKARRRALDVLFEAAARECDPIATLTERRRRSDPPISAYTVRLVEGVSAHAERIDELLASYAEGWSLARMPTVDLAALRIATFELLWCDDVPDAVAVSEAVELVTSLSTDESPRFVNGLLGRLVQLKPSLAL